MRNFFIVISFEAAVLFSIIGYYWFFGEGSRYQAARKAGGKS